ncbi:MAG: ankyrin repeat domain-containing protein [Candidatus Omnitrophica bacterium]|nr:ankyrin repeat domain-containing protein [Candidatus Omnitrophota bacterium]
MPDPKSKPALAWALALWLVALLVSSASYAEERSGWGRFFDRFRESFDDYPLHTAVRRGLTEDVERLLNEGSDPNESDDNGYAPLHFAAWKGDEEIASALIAAGATLEAHHPPYGETPLLIAIQSDEVDLVNFLIDQGADYRAPNDVDQTPLTFAAQVGNAKVLRLLLDLGVAPDDKTDFGTSALFNAAANGHIESASLLIEHGADLQGETWKGSTPLYAAVYYGQPEMVGFLLDARGGAEPGRVEDSSVLLIAVSMGHREVVETLLDRGADPNWRFDAESHSSLHLACKLGRRKIAESLIHHGALVNATNWLDLTPLHYALLGQHCRLAESLMEAGADSAAADEYGMNPDQLWDLVNSSKGRELIPASTDESPFDPRAVLPIYTLANPLEGYPIASSGVAFAFGHEGRIATAAHCVDEFVDQSTSESLLSPFVFSAYYGDFIGVEVESVDVENDVAILRADWPEHPAFQLATADDIATATQLLVAAYPPPVTECACNTVPYRVYYEAMPLLRHDPSLHSMAIAMGEGQYVGPGWSGSPIVLPDTGRVVGVFGRHHYELVDEEYLFHDLFGADISPVLALLNSATESLEAAPKDPMFRGMTTADSQSAVEAVIDFLEADERGETDSAKRAVSKFLEFRPDSVAGHLLLAGYAVMDLEEDPEDPDLRSLAEEHFQMARTLSPEDPLGAVGYASYLNLTGRSEEALKQIEGDNGIRADSWERRQLKLEILARIDPEKAIRYCRELEQEGVVSIQDHWFKLAGVLRDEGNYEEGLVAIQKAVDLVGDDDPSYRPRLANLLAHVGRHDEAEKVYRQLFALCPDNTYYWLWYSEFLADHPGDRIEDAKRAYRRSVELDEYEMVETEERERVFAKIEGHGEIVPTAEN